jgi:hypothetical protein
MSPEKETPDTTPRNDAPEIEPSVDEWTNIHARAVQLRTEIELMRLTAETEIAAIERKYRADMLTKQDELDRLWYRTQAARLAAETDRSGWPRMWPQWDPPEVYSSSPRRSGPRSRRATARYTREPTVNRAADETSRLLRSLGAAMAEPPQALADASNILRDSPGRQSSRRRTPSRRSDSDSPDRLADAFDRILDMPADVVDRFYEMFDDE